MRRNGLNSVIGDPTAPTVSRRPLWNGLRERGIAREEACGKTGRGGQPGRAKEEGARFMPASLTESPME